MREYYYSVDRKGALYHDSTELTDEKFLKFFFSRLKRNSSENNQNYPYVSPCGKEMNYLNCTLSPVVFTSFQNGFLIYQGGLCERLLVEKLELIQGQIFHPAGEDQIPGSFSTNLLAEFSNYLNPENDKIYRVQIPGYEPFRLIEK